MAVGQIGAAGHTQSTAGEKMIKGTKISLSTFQSEQEIDEYAIQYMDLENRSLFDHTEIYSKPGIVKRYHETGFWSDSQGTMLIRTSKANLIGEVSFRTKSSIELIVGYRIFTEENRGHGYGAEALSLFTSYLFTTKQIERVTLEIPSENLPSIRIAEKCGYKLEGTLRRAYFFRGKITDMAIYGILRSEIEDQ